MIVSKFKEIYSAKFDEIIPISEIFLAAAEKSTRYANDFKDQMFCPECRKAELTYAHTTKGYIKTKCGSEHSIDCSMSPEKQEREHINHRVVHDMQSDEANEILNNRLHSIFDSTINAANSANNQQKYKTTEGKSFTKNNQQNNKHSRTIADRIPRKKIDESLAKPENHGIFMFFYGDVMFKWQNEIDDDGAHLCKICSHKTDKSLCVIKFSKKVYSHLNPDYYNIDNQYCHVAFLAKLHKSTEYRKYNTSLLRSDKIIITPL